MNRSLDLNFTPTFAHFSGNLIPRSNNKRLKCHAWLTSGNCNRPVDLCSLKEV